MESLKKIPIHGQPFPDFVLVQRELENSPV